MLSVVLSGAKAAFSTGSGRMPECESVELQRLEGHILSIQGFVAQSQGDIPASIQLYEKAESKLAVDDLLPRCANHYFWGISYLKNGDIFKASSYLEKASVEGRESRNYAIVLSSQAYLAGIEMQRARLDRAAEICRQTIHLGTQWGSESCPLPYPAPSLVILSEIMYEQNNRDDATKQVTEGIKLAETSYNWTFVLKGCRLMARLEYDRSNTQTAQEYIHRVDEVAPLVSRSIEGSQVQAWKTRIALSRGKIDAALDWARQAEIDLPLAGVPSFLNEYSFLTMVMVRIAVGECRNLPLLLDGIIKRAGDQGRNGSVIEALFLKALAQDRLGETSGAITSLDKALMLAAPGGYLRMFIDERMPVSGLLRRLISLNKHTGYASKLLELISLQPGVNALTGIGKKSTGMVETLSEREIEVLNLIAEGCSNLEIATRLFLATGTVKKHVYNIFAKLGVKNRTLAVARARELGII